MTDAIFLVHSAVKKIGDMNFNKPTRKFQNFRAKKKLACRGCRTVEREKIVVVGRRCVTEAVLMVRKLLKLFRTDCDRTLFQKLFWKTVGAY